MKNLNKYTNTAAYTADTNRPTNQSTVSLIEDGTGVKFDGKNVLVEKAGAGIGDICVYNKILLRKQFVKEGTYAAATFPSNLVIMGVVYYRTENKVHMVGTTDLGLTQWAAPFRAKLSGFDFATGGTFTITVNTSITPSIVYLDTDTLATTASKVQTALNSGAANTALANWIVVADVTNNCIIASRSFYTPPLTIFTVADVALKVTTSIICEDWQTKLTGFLTSYGSITREDGSFTSSAGGNFEKSYAYFYVNGGDTATNQVVGVGNPIRFSRYNLTDNALIVNFYGTGEAGYLKYIQAKMTKFPYSKNAIIDKNGKTNTDLLSAANYVDVDLSLKPIFPAAAIAKAFGLTVAGHVTGMEVGNWWLPSAQELLLLERGFKLDYTDAINKTLIAIAGTKVNAASAYWSSSEINSNSSLYYNGAIGAMGSVVKFGLSGVRAVSAF